MLVEVVEYELEENLHLGMDEGCWVIDGLPQTAEQADEMIAAGLIPDYLINLESGIL